MCPDKSTYEKTFQIGQINFGKTKAACVEVNEHKDDTLSITEPHTTFGRSQASSQMEMFTHGQGAQPELA